METLSCKECVNSQKESKVYLVSSMSTLIGCSPFFDSYGKCHYHDTNTITETFKCSEGHFFKRKIKPGVCDCGWRADAL